MGDSPFLLAYEQDLIQRVAVLSRELDQLRELFVEECRAPPPPPPPPPPPRSVQRTPEEWAFLAEEVELTVPELRSLVDSNELKGKQLATYNRLVNQGVRISEEKVPSDEELEAVTEDTGISKTQLKRQKYRLTVEQYVRLTEKRKKTIEELKSQRLAATERFRRVVAAEENRPSFESEHKEADKLEAASNVSQQEEFVSNIEAIENDWGDIQGLVDDLIKDKRKLVDDKEAKESIRLMVEQVPKWVARYRDYLWLTRVPRGTQITETRRDYERNDEVKVTLTFDPDRYDIALAKMNDALDLLKKRLEEAEETGEVEDLEGEFRLSAILDEALTEELHEV